MTHSVCNDLTHMPNFLTAPILIHRPLRYQSKGLEQFRVSLLTSSPLFASTHAALSPNLSGAVKDNITVNQLNNNILIVKHLPLQEKLFQLIDVRYCMYDYNLHCVSAAYAHSYNTLPLQSMNLLTHITEELFIYVCMCSHEHHFKVLVSDTIRPAANHQGNSCHP